MATTLHDMIGDAGKAKFPYHIDVRYFTTISRDMRFTYSYVIVLTASREFWIKWVLWGDLRLSLQVAGGLKSLEGPYSSLVSHTNTILTCYGELGIFH